MHLLHRPCENEAVAEASPHRVAIFNGLAGVTMKIMNSYGGFENVR